MKMLIVENSPLIRRMYALAFSRRDHELVEAEDGRHPLAVLSATADAPHVILLDLQMPGMNGVDFLCAVPKLRRFSEIPIVITTAEPDTSDLVQRAAELGVAAIVKKPWKPQELVEVVQKVIARYPPRNV
jgi:DNA-binding response OmpR family regulator